MKITVKSLSYSTVSQYIQCPEKVFLEKIDCLPKIGNSVNLVYGVSLHTVCEAYSRGLMLNHRFSAEILKRVFVQKWNDFNEDQIIYGKNTKDELFALAYKMIDLLIEAEPPYQILSIERPVHIPIQDDFVIIGKADLVFRDKDGMLCVTDVKTSAKAYSDEDLLNTSYQAFTYSQIFNEPVKLKVFLFVKTKIPRFEVIDLDISKVDYAEWRNRFLQVKRAIEAGIRFKIRGWTCSTCPLAYHCLADTKQESSQLKLAA